MKASVFLFLHACLGFEVDERLKMLEGVRFSPEQKHRELLENVIEFGLNQSQYLQEIQERDLWTKGASFLSQPSSLYINWIGGVSLSKRQPAHFVSVFNKQQKEAKMLSR